MGQERFEENLNNPLHNLVDSWTWGTTYGLLERQSQIVEQFSPNTGDYAFFALLTHYARTEEAQLGINKLGGIVTSYFTAPHFLHGDRAIAEIQHRLGTLSLLYTIGDLEEKRLNVFLAPIPRKLVRAAKKVARWEKGEKKNRCPESASTEISRLLLVGSLKRPPYGLSELKEVLGEDNFLLTGNLIRTNNDVQKSLHWLTAEHRIAVI